VFARPGWWQRMWILSFSVMARIDSCACTFVVADGSDPCSSSIKRASMWSAVPLRVIVSATT
jgi:hypothetical protein